MSKVYIRSNRKTEFRFIYINKFDNTIFSHKLKYVCNQPDGTNLSPELKHIYNHHYFTFNSNNCVIVNETKIVL